ncbi:MAG TPA: alpha/beta hydrolase [Anaerolineae bacterium]|nr:alpha/beta hydrolase [Anaerolineae bacterium]
MKRTRSKNHRIRTGIAGMFVVGFLLIILASCSGGDAQIPASPTNPIPHETEGSPPVASTAIPRFEPGECAAPIALSFRHHCGWLVTLEDRTKPDGGLVRLPVVIFEARASDPKPDPVIYLAGGGGVDQLAMMDLYEPFVLEVISERDFIMYNQRGAPRTDPELECEGLLDLLWELAEQHPSLEERNLRLAEFWSACRSDLVAQGIDLNMYSTSANAADANDLRIALGIEQANYYGTSYGTRIGLFLLRDWGEGVRSMILDSTYPPEANYYTSYASNVAGGLISLFDECGSDPACADRYGDLERLFNATVSRLDAEPEVLTYSNGRVVVDGQMYINVLYALLQSTPGRQAVPSFIESASRGDFELFHPVYPALFEYRGSMAVYYSFQCREEVPKHAFDEVVAEAAGVPASIRDYAVQFFAALDYALCDVWDVEPYGAGEMALVESDVPALVLAGAYDPITPPQWGRSAANFLSRAWFFEIPGHSHGTMRTSACARDIALAFLEDPGLKPDAACIENAD